MDIAGILLGIVIVLILLVLLSKVKNKNQELNDYYPFTDKGDLK